MDPHSTHQPFRSGGLVTVTGSAVVDTKQRQVQDFHVALAAEPTATECIVGAVLLDESGPTKRLMIYVKAADGATDGVNPVMVSWGALGK